MNPGLIKGLGMLATGIGFGATLLANWVGNEAMKKEIKEGIEAALDERNKEES
jgi:predicted alpha/beta-fold hydrolase